MTKLKELKAALDAAYAVYAAAADAYFKERGKQNDSN